MAKARKNPRVTKALAHYEAALAMLQEVLATQDRATLEAINARYLAVEDTPIPGALPMMYAVHMGGDAIRAAKAELDPARMLPSSTPKIEEAA